MSTPQPRPVDLAHVLATPTEAEIELGFLFRRSEPLVIFDIGACECEDSIRFARHYPRGRVFAFEPLPANVAIATENLQRYGAAAVSLAPVALAESAGEREFHVSSGRPPGTDSANWNFGNKSSSLLAPASAEPMHGWIEFNKTIRVPTQTLDAFCTTAGIKHIDFIHMDVQGAELLVLRGATATLPHVTAVWLEVSCKENYRGQPLAEEVGTFMRARGFRLAFSTYRDERFGEGDHLYLNLRSVRSWLYLILRPPRRLAGSIRRALFNRSP